MLTGSGWAVLVATVLLLGAGAAAGYPELLVLGLAGVVVLVVAGVWMALGPDVVARRIIVGHHIAQARPPPGKLWRTWRAPPSLRIPWPSDV